MSFSLAGSFLPMDDDKFKDCWNVWKGVSLLKNCIVNNVVVPAKDELVEIEDVSDDSIPSFCGQQHAVSRPDRIFQIGQSGATSVLASLLDSQAKCILFVDVCAHTGDFLKGFFNILGMGNAGANHLYMLCFSDDEAKAWRV